MSSPHVAWRTGNGADIFPIRVATISWKGFSERRSVLYRRQRTSLSNALERHHGRHSGDVPALQAKVESALLLNPSFAVVHDVTGGNPISCAPVGLGNIVLDVLAANAPHAPSTDLKSAQLPRPNETLNEALLHVQLVGDLRQSQEAGLGRFNSHPAILSVRRSRESS
jgi:hypothetical protein